MNRPDLIKKYSEETGSNFDLLRNLLDFTVTNLEVLKYVEWLEEKLENKEFYQQLEKEQKKPLTGEQAIHDLCSNLKGFHL
jgi:hypothetical protein